MLLDELLPAYDVRERHRTQVRASAAATYAAILRADLAASPIVQALLAVRALPTALLAGREGVSELRRRRHEPVTIGSFERHGFRIIAERAPEEIVIGLEGRFWSLDGALCTPPAHAFRDGVPPRPGTARAAWNFVVRERAGGVELATETRVQCADAATRHRFLPYWLVVRGPSGLIRRLMLRAIRRAAEGRGT